MKCRGFTLWRPWGALIAYGQPPKRVENRDWAPPRWALEDEGRDLDRTGRCAVRGLRLLIRNGGTVDEAILHRTRDLGIVQADKLPGVAGDFVAVADVVSVLATDVLPPGDPARREHGLYLCGPFGWVLFDVRVLDRPVNFSGAGRCVQGLFTVPEVVLREVLAQVGHEFEPEPTVRDRLRGGGR